MARVRSTARVEREGAEAEGSETVPISEAMQRSGLVTSEGIRTAETGGKDADLVVLEDNYDVLQTYCMGQPKL